MRPVQVWGYLDEYAADRTEILNAVDQVFSSGQLVMGKSLEEFERNFAEYLNLPHCIGLDNCTNAISIGLQSLGIQSGDEVITVANTAAPTATGIEATGATPVFVDVRESDYLMDTELLPAAITERTRAIVPVHLYGQCVNMERVTEIAAKYGLQVVEDCAQAHGAQRHRKFAGSFGSAAAFSFYPTKILGAYGDGGALVTRSETLAEKVRRLRFYGMHPQNYVVERSGHNSRLDEVQAAILSIKLTKLNSYLSARRRIADFYQRNLQGTPGLILPQTAEHNEHAYYLYVVRHPQRAEILSRLSTDFNIELNISYPWPLHRMPGFTHLFVPPGGLPVTEKLAGEIFSLPMYPSLPQEYQERVISALQIIIGKLA